MFDATAIISALGGALAGGAIAFGVMKLRELRRRLHDLEAKVAKIGACSKHDLAYLIRRDAGEASLFDLAHVREQAKLLNDWVEYATLRAQHVAEGGSPDDLPTAWKKK